MRKVLEESSDRLSCKNPLKPSTFSFSEAPGKKTGAGEKIKVESSKQLF